MNRRHAIPAFAGFARWLDGEARSKHHVRYVSGIDRWRPGSVIPAHNCAGAEWEHGLGAAIANWVSCFSLATMQADGCADQGIVVRAEYEPPAADGSTWHGKVVALNHDRDGYLCYVAIAFNNYWYRDFATDDPARAALACHELGHALGATHAPSGTGGCLQVPPPSTGIDAPGPWTITQLIDAYNAPLVPIGKKPRRRKHGRGQG